MRNFGISVGETEDGDIEVVVGEVVGHDEDSLYLRDRIARILSRDALDIPEELELPRHSTTFKAAAHSPKQLDIDAVYTPDTGLTVTLPRGDDTGAEAEFTATLARRGCAGA